MMSDSDREIQDSVDRLSFIERRLARAESRRAAMIALILGALALAVLLISFYDPKPSPDAQTESTLRKAEAYLMIRNDATAATCWFEADEMGAASDLYKINAKLYSWTSKDDYKKRLYGVIKTCNDVDKASLREVFRAEAARQLNKVSERTDGRLSGRLDGTTIFYELNMELALYLEPENKDLGDVIFDMKLMETCRAAGATRFKLIDKFGQSFDRPIPGDAQIDEERMFNTYRAKLVRHGLAR